MGRHCELADEAARAGGHSEADGCSYQLTETASPSSPPGDGLVKFLNLVGSALDSAVDICFSLKIMAFSPLR